jgi:hypothetical protein
VTLAAVTMPMTKKTKMTMVMVSPLLTLPMRVPKPLPMPWAKLAQWLLPCVVCETAPDWMVPSCFQTSW